MAKDVRVPEPHLLRDDVSSETDANTDDERESDDPLDPEGPWDSLAMSRAALSMMGVGVVIAAVVWLVSLLR